jgi:RNA polymerase sigma-70 factor (ECF subfamily)
MFSQDEPFSPLPPSAMVRRAEESAEQRRREVYDSHRHRVFAVAYYMTANELAAEEVMTESFLRAFRQSPSPSGELVDTSLVAELGERLPLEERAEPAQPLAGAALAGNVLRTDMEEALNALPARERLIFLLRDVEGYEAGRVAALLGCEAGEIHRTLVSARLRMHQQLLRIRQERAA